MSVQFHESALGRKFLEHDFPRAVKALNAIADNLSSQKAQLDADEALESAILKMTDFILSNLSSYPHLCKICTKGCVDASGASTGKSCRHCIAEALRNAAG